MLGAGNTSQRAGPLEVGGAVPQTAPISAVTRRHKSGLLNFARIRQKMTTTTEDAVLRASS